MQWSKDRVNSIWWRGDVLCFFCVYLCVFVCVFVYVFVCVFVCAFVVVVCERCSRAEIGSILLGGEEAGRDPGLTVAKSNGASTPLYIMMMMMMNMVESETRMIYNFKMVASLLPP